MRFFFGLQPSCPVLNYIYKEKNTPPMKLRIHVLLAAAAVIVLAGCTNAPVEPRFGLLSIDTLVSGGTQECRVEYRFATILNAGDSPALAAIEQANIACFFGLEDFLDSAREAAEASLREIIDEYRSDSMEMTYEISAEAEGAVVDTLVTYVITRSSYLGGAHGMYGTECRNYTLSDGYQLTLADLFSEEQRQRIDARIRAQLYGEYGVQNDEQLAERGFFPEYIAATDNFLITEQGLTFYYNPYDIGCYAQGPVEVTLPADEVHRIREGLPDPAQ